MGNIEPPPAEAVRRTSSWRLRLCLLFRAIALTLRVRHAFAAAHVALEVGIAIRIPWRKHDDACRCDDEILEAASRLVVQFRYQRRTVLFEQVDTNCQRHCGVV